jgi:hypothetical protein
MFRSVLFTLALAGPGAGEPSLQYECLVPSPLLLADPDATLPPSRFGRIVLSPGSFSEEYLCHSIEGDNWLVELIEDHIKMTETELRTPKLTPEQVAYLVQDLATLRQSLDTARTMKKDHEEKLARIKNAPEERTKPNPLPVAPMPRERRVD